MLPASWQDLQEFSDQVFKPTLDMMRSKLDTLTQSFQGDTLSVSPAIPGLLRESVASHICNLGLQ